MGYGAFNHVLINWYNDGSHYIGPHSDSEAQIVEDSPIVSVSLGQERTFRIRYKTNKKLVGACKNIIRTRYQKLPKQSVRASASTLRFGCSKSASYHFRVSSNMNDVFQLDDISLIISPSMSSCFACVRQVGKPRLIAYQMYHQVVYYFIRCVSSSWMLFFFDKLFKRN